MKTIFEKKLEWYSNKSYLGKIVWEAHQSITYAIKRWPRLKPELKDKYFKAMLDAKLIKEWEYTRDTLFDLEKEVWEKKEKIQ